MRRKVYHEVKADLEFTLVAEESFAASVAGLFFSRLNDCMDEIFVVSKTKDRFANTRTLLEDGIRCVSQACPKLHPRAGVDKWDHRVSEKKCETETLHSNYDDQAANVYRRHTENQDREALTEPQGCKMVYRSK